MNDVFSVDLAIIPNSYKIGKKYFLITVMLARNIYILHIFAYITLSKEQEFGLPTNYPIKTYSILILNNVIKPTSNIYSEKLFENTTVDWSKI